MSQTTTREGALLVQMDGETIRQQWALDKDVLRIGRAADNDILIEDRWVSRYHAEIYRQGLQYTVCDLGSKNGTFVNGRRLVKPHQLEDGDQITTTPLCILTFVDYAATAPLPGQRLPVFKLEPETRNVHSWGKRLTPPLSQIQYDFLALLMQEPGRAYNRDEVIASVWPGEDPGGISDDAVNALVHRLRQRLRELAPDNEFIVTVRGYGFRLVLPENI